MLINKTSALAKLTPEERKKVLTLAAEVTLARHIMKRRAARQAKLREELAAERRKKQEEAWTNSTSSQSKIELKTRSVQCSE